MVFTHGVAGVSGVAFALSWIASPIAMGADDLSLMTVRTGQAKWSALFQSWGVNDDTQSKSTFRIRRAELQVGGTMLERTRWYVMVDAAKVPSLNSSGDNKILQDLLLAYEFVPQWEFIAGQFKIQTTAEGLDPSSELLFPERSTIARKVGDIREMGAMVVAKNGKFWRVSAMVSNGPPANTENTNVAPDLSARVEGSPMEGLSGGVFLLANDFQTDAKRAIGFNVRWEGKQELVRGDFIQEKYPGTGTSSLLSRGYVLDLAYKFVPELQGAIRYENYRPNTDADFTSSAVTVGVNFFLLRQNIKFQADYAWLYNMTGGSGSPILSRTPVPQGRLVWINFQMAI